MDPADMLNVRFHFGGEFLRIGPQLDYVGGDEGMSFIERNKLSFQEIRGHLTDHTDVKKSMKYYFLIPGRAMAEGLVFLYDDSGCIMITDHVTGGGVADLYVEYHGEEEEHSSDESGSNFEDEIGSASEPEEPDVVITAEDTNQIRHDVSTSSSQVFNPSSQSGTQDLVQKVSVSTGIVEAHRVEVGHSDNFESESEDSDYVPHSDDSGEESEVVELRRNAKEFKKKIRNSQMWAEGGPSGTVHIDLVANVEEVQENQNMDEGFESDDEDYSYDEDEGGQIVRRRSKFTRYDPNTEVPHFSLGMVFTSKNQMCKSLRKYGLVTHKSIRFMKSEQDRVRAKCGWPGCPWLIYGAKRSRCSRFQIITYEYEHHCAPNRDNHLVTAKVIAKRFEHFIMANPTWKIESMKSIVLKEFFADVSTSKCKAAKKIVMDKLLEGMQGEYTKVFDYQLELLRSNPGSTIVVCMDPTNMEHSVFQRFYVCFNALKMGFKSGCRRVIGLDGCFFKGACQGELLCAIARDANNQMYPVAWAVVEQETTENWEWFLGLLIKDLNINENGAGWVFISDQQKGLINSMRAYLPRAEHRMCARHIYANWRKKHRDHALQKKFWAIAKASNREDFMYHKAKLALETPDGAKDIMKTDPKHWARAFFPIGSMCESVDNNLCESFNHAIIESRFYPIISMLEKIRCKIYVRIQENREKSEKWHGTICPNIFKKLKISIKRTQFCEVLWNGKEGFEVKHVSGRGRKYTVNLEQKTCSCGYFQLAGLPCCHAISAIYKCGKIIDDYIDKCYSIEEFKKNYDHCLQPVEGESKWPISQNPRPRAPGYIRMPGRPKKNDRRREEGEAPKGKKMSKHGTKIKCGFCGSAGHNKTGCKQNPERGRKKNAFLVKAGRKMKAAEQAQTDGHVNGSQQVQRKGKEKLQGTEPITRKRKDNKGINIEANTKAAKK